MSEAAAGANRIPAGEEPTEDAVETGSSQETDALAESLPFDPVVLDRAIEHYLNQIDSLGNTLADLLKSDGAWLWLAGTAAASAAAAVVYRRARRSRSELAALVDGEEAISSWFLESTSEG